MGRAPRKSGQPRACDSAEGGLVMMDELFDVDCTLFETAMFGAAKTAAKMHASAFSSTLLLSSGA